MSKECERAGCGAVPTLKEEEEVAPLNVGAEIWVTTGG